MKIDQTIFKAYDVRGIANEQITPQIAYLIGRAYVRIIKPEPKIIGVGQDVRSHGEEFKKALIKGLTDAGMEVVDLGVISTDMLYYAVDKYGYGGGITVSASHNPQEYNGFKMVRQGSQAISSETGLMDIRDEVIRLNDLGEQLPKDMTVLDLHKKEILLEDYIAYMMTFVDVDILKSKEYKITFNANHGYAGEVITKIVQDYNLPIKIGELFMKPNGTFPQGKPDPLQEANQIEMKNAIIKNGSDFGVSWDADADRCFFFAKNGEPVESYFVVAILSKIMLEKFPGSKIIHDPRLIWAIDDAVKDSGGISIVNKVGHSFIKAAMRKENAVFAGENSGHYYFKDYFYADNGIIPFLLILEYLIKNNTTIEELIFAYKEKYFISGEINLTVSDTNKIIKNIENKYNDGKVEFIDGLSVEYSDWRFNVRSSNTEPLLRVSVEAKSSELLQVKTKELLDLINNSN